MILVNCYDQVQMTKQGIEFAGLKIGFEAGVFKKFVVTREFTNHSIEEYHLL